MKNRFIVLLGIFTLTFISTELVAQNLFLSGDAVLFVHSKGLVVSTGSLKLSGNRLGIWCRNYYPEGLRIYLIEKS